MLHNPSLVLPLHCAYVSGSVYLPTRGVLNIAGIPTPLPHSRGPLADLEGAHMPIVLNCPGALDPQSLTAEDIPGRRLVVLDVLGIAGVASCVPVAGPSTASSPVILISVEVVGLGSSVSLCPEKWITAPHFVDATGSCRSGCSRLVTSPIFSFRRACTDPCHLRLDIAFPLP